MAIPQPPRQHASLRDLGFSRLMLTGSVVACGAVPAILGWLLDAPAAVVLTAGLAGTLSSLAWNSFVSLRVRRNLAAPIEELMTAVEQLRTTGHAPRIAEVGAPILKPILRRFNLAGLALEQRDRQSHANLMSVEAAFDRVHAVLQSLREGVAVVDPEGRLVMANRFAKRLLHAEKRVEGAPIGDLVSGPLREALLQGLGDVDGDRVGEYRTSDIEHNGRIYDLTIVQVQSSRPDQDYGKVVVLIDVTRNHEINRLKDELLSSISHELRTPLTNMCSSTEILSSLTPQDEVEWREFANMLYTESTRLKALVDDVMEYSQIDARADWRYEVASCRGLIDAAAEAMRPAASAKGIELVVECGGDAQAEIEPRRAQEVICRLLDNAIKFTPPAGTIRLSLRAHEGMAEFAVDDSGPGIAPEDRPRAFERFSQIGNVMTDKPQGTGLGLPISQRVVDAMGGTIWCEESDLGGARFCFVLPLLGAFAKG